MIVLTILPPSSAGIGKILKTARANDIMAAKIKRYSRHPTAIISLPILVAPIGPLN
jgi:hypothetical protein